MRKTYPSGDPRDARIGYSRAVRAGSMVFVSGTTALRPDGVVEVEQASDQFRLAMARVAEVLGEADAALSDVVRNTVYVSASVTADDLEAIAYVHGDVFAGVDPALAIIQVAALPGGPLVEIETTAVIDR